MKIVAILALALLASLHQSAAQTTVISPAALSAAYKANAIQADTLYRGSYLEVTGKITNIYRAIDGEPYVTIDGAVTEYFPTSKEALVASLHKGQTVTLTGICQGDFLGMVTLRDR